MDTRSTQPRNSSATGWDSPEMPNHSSDFSRDVPKRSHLPKDVGTDWGEKCAASSTLGCAGKDRVDNVASRGYIAAMKAVGIRELKNRLSEYLRLVQGGEEVLVTDRGEVVAELRQPSKSHSDAPDPGLMKLIRQGKARGGAPNLPALYPRLPALLSKGELAKLIAEERADR